MLVLHWRLKMTGGTHHTMWSVLLKELGVWHLSGQSSKDASLHELSWTEPCTFFGFYQLSSSLLLLMTWWTASRCYGFQHISPFSNPNESKSSSHKLTKDFIPHWTKRLVITVCCWPIQSSIKTTQSMDTQFIWCPSQMPTVFGTGSFAQPFQVVLWDSTASEMGHQSLDSSKRKWLFFASWKACRVAVQLRSTKQAHHTSHSKSHFWLQALGVSTSQA